MRVKRAAVGFAVLCLGSLCASAGDAPPAKGAPKPAPAGKGDPMAAKRKRMGELLKEAFAVQEQVQANPEMRQDPATLERMQAVMKEGDEIMAVLTGGDKSRQDAVMEEVIAAHLPERLEAFRQGRAQARIAMAKAQLRSLLAALEQYNMTNGNYPSPEKGGLKALVGKSEGPPLVDGGEKSLLDPWGNAFAYEWNPGGFILRSAGPDGKLDTKDDLTPE